MKKSQLQSRMKATTSGWLNQISLLMSMLLKSSNQCWDICIWTIVPPIWPGCAFNQQGTELIFNISYIWQSLGGLPGTWCTLDARQQCWAPLVRQQRCCRLPGQPGSPSGGRTEPATQHRNVFVKTTATIGINKCHFSRYLLNLFAETLPSQESLC